LDQVDNVKDFAGQKILLGVTGGVAVYKSAYLIRALRKLGAEVRVVMTESATQFMTPLSFQALSGHPVSIDLLDTEAEHAMGHIALARWADYLIIAPATAHCMAKMAHGLADDLLSTLALVVEVPILICPSMNQSMWRHPATQANFILLKQRGVMFIGPDVGEQACGEYGLGRMVDVQDIVDALRLHQVGPQLQGHHVVITAGPTREGIDPVRYMSNYSSGKMGYALARAALCAGAEVTLITGPTHLAYPSGCVVITVTSAQEMYTAVMETLDARASSIFIGAAAVADFYIESPPFKKIKKQKDHELALKLIPNPDILSHVVTSQKASYVVGFAAETHDLMHHAQEKFKHKKPDMLIANWVGEHRGFDQEENEVIIFTAETIQTLSKMHKVRLAGYLIAIIATSLHNGMQKKLIQEKKIDANSN
jgi:phosphopantothenoylcysteine decarboxylase/phosphopantothenate--cysteine ligase